MSRLPSHTHELTATEVATVLEGRQIVMSGLNLQLGKVVAFRVTVSGILTLLRCFRCKIRAKYLGPHCGNGVDNLRPYVGHM